MNWYLKVLRHYADFQGRARRKEYWMFVLFNLIFSVVAITLDNALGITFGPLGYGAIYVIYALFVLIPGLAAFVRSSHDIGKPGWMILIGLIPFIGWIWLLMLLVLDSQPGSNEYGPNPKEPQSSAAHF